MWSAGSIENHSTGVPHDSDQWNSSDWPNSNPKYVCREGRREQLFLQSLTFLAFNWLQATRLYPIPTKAFVQDLIKENDKKSSFNVIAGMYYATVMVLTTAATVLGVMVLRIHHQVFAIIIVIVDVVVMTNHHDTRRRCHSIGLFDWQSGHLDEQN